MHICELHAVHALRMLPNVLTMSLGTRCARAAGRVCHRPRLPIWQRYDHQASCETVLFLDCSLS